MFEKITCCSSEDLSVLIHTMPCPVVSDENIVIGKSEVPINSTGENETIIEESIENDCNCRFCKNVSFEYIKEALYQERMLQLCCHNSWVTESVAEELYRNAGTLDQLAHFMNHKSPKERKIPKAIDALYAAEEMKEQNIRTLQLLLE